MKKQQKTKTKNRKWNQNKQNTFLNMAQKLTIAQLNTSIF